MKKIIILIVVLGLFSIMAYGETKEIFDDWLYSGNTTTVDGKNFTLTMGSRLDKIYLKLPTENSVIVSNESCDKKDYYNVCYKGTKEGYHDYFRDVIVMQAHITIEQITAKLNISRTVQKTNPQIGEDVRIVMNLENDGDRDATGVVFNDEFPEDFEITYVSGCVISGNKVEWEGNLKRSERKKECEYRIKPLKEVTYSSKATATYNNGDKETTSSSPTVKITVQEPPLDIRINSSRTTLDLGEEFWVNITLENINEDKDVSVDNFIISVPESMEIIEKRGIDSDKLYWRGNLRPTGDMEKEIKLKIKTKKTGNKSINLTALYSAGGIKSEAKREVEIETNHITKPSIMFLGLEEGVKTDGKKNIEVYVENLDEKYSFHNIKIKVDESDLPIEINGDVIELASRRHEKIGEIGAIDAEIGNYTLKGIVESETEYGERFENRFEKSIEVVENLKVEVIEKASSGEKAEESVIGKNVNLGGNTYKVTITKESLIFGLPLIFIIIISIRHMIKKYKQKKYEIEV